MAKIDQNPALQTGKPAILGTILRELIFFRLQTIIISSYQ